MPGFHFRFGLALCLAVAAAAGLAAPRGRPAGSLDPVRVNDSTQTPTIARGARGSAVLRAQILLARVHFSCGEIDALYGRTLENTVAALQASQGLPADGVVKRGLWDLLNEDRGEALIRATIEPEDVAGPFDSIPEAMADKAKLRHLNYASPLEAIAEKFHASPKLLAALNPSVSFDRAGVEILVPDVSAPVPDHAAKIVVSESRRSVEAFDAQGRILAHYPASTGSRHDPLPIGTWKILGVARDPVFHFNPRLFWDAQDQRSLAIAPGPNNPVGSRWIDLSKAHYGIHGTPEPSQIGRTQSHGCIRMTNWDVIELSRMVRPGVPAILEK